MDKLTAALLKAFGLICFWCASLIGFLLCLYLTASAFEISVPLGLVALFVDAVIIATVYYYGEDDKPTSGRPV